MLPALPFVELPRKNWLHDTQEKKPRLHLPDIEEKNLIYYSQEKFNRDFIDKLNKEKEKEALKSNTDNLIKKLKKKKSNSRPSTNQRRNARKTVYGIDAMNPYSISDSLSRPITPFENENHDDKVDGDEQNFSLIKKNTKKNEETVLQNFNFNNEDNTEAIENLPDELIYANKLKEDLILLPPKHRSKNDPYYNFIRKKNLENLYLQIIEGDDVNDDLIMTRLHSHTTKLNFFGRKKKKFQEAILYETKLYKENIEKTDEKSEKKEDDFDLIEHLAKLIPSEAQVGNNSAGTENKDKPVVSHLDELRNYLKYGKAVKDHDSSDEESVYSDIDIYKDPYYGLPKDEYDQLHLQLKTRREEEEKEKEKIRLANFDKPPPTPEKMKIKKITHKKKEYVYNNNASLLYNLFRYTVRKIEKAKTYLSNIHEIKKEVNRAWRHTWNWRSRLREKRMNPLLKSIYMDIIKESEAKKKEYIENMLALVEESDRSIQKELDRRKKILEHEERLKLKDINKSLLSPMDSEELRRRNLEAKKNLFYTNTLYDWKKEGMQKTNEYKLPKINNLDIDKYPDLTSSLEIKMKEKWKKSLELQKEFAKQEEEIYLQDKEFSYEIETLMARYGTIDLSDRLTYEKLKNLHYYDEKDKLVRELLGFNNNNYNNSGMGGELDTIIEKIDNIQHMIDDNNSKSKRNTNRTSNLVESSRMQSIRPSFSHSNSFLLVKSRQPSFNNGTDWDNHSQMSDISTISRRAKKERNKHSLEASKQVDKLLSYSKTDIKKLKMKHSSYLLNDISSNIDSIEEDLLSAHDDIYYPQPHGSTLYLVLRSDINELKSTSLLSKLRKHRHQRFKNKNLYDDEEEEYVDLDDFDDFNDDDESHYNNDKKLQSPFDFDFRNPTKFHRIPHAYSSDEEEDDDASTSTKKKSSKKSFIKKKFIDLHKNLRELTRIKASNIFEIGALALGIEIADLGSTKSHSIQNPPLDLSSLHTLAFNRACMGNRGFIQILQGIKYASLTSLRVLDLRHNYLTAVTLFAMLELGKLDLFPQLEVVLLSENEGKDEMTEAIVQWILSGSMMKNMRELHLQNNSITDTGFSRIVKVLLAVGSEFCPKLNRLALEKNPISAKIKRDLAPLPSSITI